MAHKPFEFILRSRKKGMTEVPKNTSIELLQLSGSIPTSIRQSQAQASTHAASAWTILRAHWLEFGWRLNQEARKHMCQLCFVQQHNPGPHVPDCVARWCHHHQTCEMPHHQLTSPTDIKTPTSPASRKGAGSKVEVVVEVAHTAKASVAPAARLSSWVCQVPLTDLRGVEGVWRGTVWYVHGCHSVFA